MSTIRNTENYLSLGSKESTRLMYLESDREDYFYSVNFRDFCVALMFLDVYDRVVLQVAFRETIPYVRRLIFNVLGEPDSERDINLFRYGNKYINIVHWNTKDLERIQENLVGFAEEPQMFYLSTDNEVHSFEPTMELDVYPASDPYDL